ncbi:MAG: MDR family MFS transporter, partial [Trueperaceae bacterium]
MSGATQREKLAAFAGVLTVLFLSSLNMTVVGTALPRIIAELEGFDLYAWAFTAFSLAATVALPISGRISDIVGRRRVLMVGIVLFTVAALLAGLSRSMMELIVFRALQGIGGGVLMSMSWAAIGDIFSPRERGKYQGWTGAVFGLSSIIGPVVGGVITDAIGWRWIFFVNVPVALLAFEAVRRYLPKSVRKPNTGLDLPGTAWLVLATVPFLIGLTWAGTARPWSDPWVIIALALGAFGLAGFVREQLRSPHPTLEPALFADRTFLFVNMATLLSAVGLFGAVIYLPLFVQGVQGGSAAASGFALAPMMIGVVIGSTVSGALASRTGRYRRWIVTGVALMLVGFALTAGFGPDTPTWWLVAVMVLLGTGIGPTNSLLTLAAQNALPADRLGAVTGTNQFFRQIGGTIGVTVFGSLIAGHVRSGLEAVLPRGDARLPPELVDTLADPNLLTDPVRMAALRDQAVPLIG